MLTIKHTVKPSQIGGLGLFADENIEKNTLIWQNNTDSEWIISESEKQNISTYMQNVFAFHGYFDKIINKWKLPLDNSRFMNHCFHPNTYMDDNGNSRAAIFIAKDEEITCDYSLFDGSERDFLKE